MVDGYRRYDRQGRPINHIGSIHTATKTNFQQRIVCLLARKSEQGRASGDFEIGDAFTGIGVVAFIQDFGQIVFGDQLTRDANTFMKTRKMGRGVGVYGFTRALKTRAHHRLRAAFAISACDMNDRWQATFRIAQRVQQTLASIQHKVDNLGMQFHHPL